jgi:CBS domain containing-hemolysin-like protein
MAAVQGQQHSWRKNSAVSNPEAIPMPDESTGPPRARRGGVALASLPASRVRRYALWGALVLALWGAVAQAAGLPPEGDPDAVAGRADVQALIAYVVLALLFSFLCSISEAVLLSLTPSYIENLAADRPRLARRLARLKIDSIDRSLAAILTLNTIAHTVGAIGAGAKATIVFGSAYFGAFSAAMTLVILFLSEIVPKTIGAVHWRRLAGPTAWFVQGLIWSLYPLILVSESLTRWIARGKTAHVFHRDDLAAMASLGERAGSLGADESRIIRNLLMLKDLTAGDVMTPRPVVMALPENTTIADALAREEMQQFSRVPVFRDTIDQVTGFVLKDEILLEQARGGSERRLVDLKRELPTVHRDLRLRRLLAFLLERRRAHIALVIDEYVGTEGLVTMEDVVETLLGLEIVDEMDRNVDMQALARRRWAERARSMGLDVDGDPAS